MFIASKKNIKVKRADGSFYCIQKGFIGTIPEDVGKNWLVKKAIESGSIVVPNNSKDVSLEKADKKAKEKAKKVDIRPDAEVSKEKIEE